MPLLTALPETSLYRLTGCGRMPSAFAVTELAHRSVAAVGLELAGLIQTLNLGTDAPEVTVDRRLASLWFGHSFRPAGWDMPALWDPIAGDYRTADGWIRLHTNLPHHRAAALSVLGCVETRDAVTAAVATWQADALEAEVVDKGGVAATMRSRADWLAHPQGRAVAAEPLVHWIAPRPVALRPRPRASAARPLAGLRVLDATRVLAGPIATRTLAGFGAEVLRIDPPGWDEPGVIPEISLGKRMASLDLRTPEGRDRFKALLSKADVLVHGLRPGALDRLGLDAATRDAVAPDRIEVTLDAYGWTGPWAGRRGFDSLVQMSSGIADAGRAWAGADKPTPLPVQALDHATGYLLAACVLSALTAAARGDAVPAARLSLARTAELLAGLKPDPNGPEIGRAGEDDFAPGTEQSDWGAGQRLRPPLDVSKTPMLWDRPAAACGTAPPAWPD